MVMMGVLRALRAASAGQQLSRCFGGGCAVGDGGGSKAMVTMIR